MVVNSIYNIVDQIFIANASYLGSYGNAANTVVFPLTVVALAIAVMIGDGCCTFVSISLGAKEKDNAHRGVGSSVIAVIAAGIILTAFYMIFVIVVKIFISLFFKKVKKLFDRIKGMRRDGLKKRGEMSIGNIVFKYLRRYDYISDLMDLKYELYDKIKSLEKV